MKKILDTQREAYERILKNLAERQRIVLDVLRAHAEGLTSHETAQILGVPLNTISGRFSELHALGVIKSVGRRVNPSGVNSHVWAEAAPEDRAPRTHYFQGQGYFLDLLPSL